MLSLCLELKTTCSACGNPLPVNGFTEKVFCTKCNKENVLNAELWASLIKDDINEINKLKEGEGQQSQIMTGGYQLDFLYGKQSPRCNKCKTSLPDNLLRDLSGNINYGCACGNEIHIRPATELLLSIVPEAKFIIGEDENLLSKVTSKPLKPESSKPVLFNCPSCSGSLAIDGSARLVVCKFCQSNVYLPDDLWFMLHPVATAARWYITLDEKAEAAKLPKWYNLSDVTIDRDGNLYFATSGDFERNFLIWSTTPDLKKRWVKEGLKLSYQDTGLTVNKSGNLLVWDKNKRSLLILSGKDGSEITKIKGEAPTKENPYSFNLLGCEALISDSDDTILALVNNTFVRFNTDGSRASLWDMDSKETHKGLFSGIFSSSNKNVNIPEGDPEWAPDLIETGNKPKRLSSYSTKINLGWDDYIYMLDTSPNDAMLAKYTRDGKQLWKKMIPLINKDSRPYTDSKGNVYIIGADEDYKARLLRFSPDGDNIEILIKDITEGSVLKYTQGERLLISREGLIYVINYGEKIRIFNPDFSIKYLSPECIEENKETLEKFNSEKTDM